MLWSFFCPINQRVCAYWIVRGKVQFGEVKRAICFSFLFFPFFLCATEIKPCVKSLQIEIRTEQWNAHGLRQKITAFPTAHNSSHHFTGKKTNKRRHSFFFLKMWKAVREKKLPPLRVAETGPAWLRQLQAGSGGSLNDRCVWCQMETRESLRRGQQVPTSTCST